MISFGAENERKFDRDSFAWPRQQRTDDAASGGSLQLEGVRFLLPQAALNRWYPQTAFGPLEANEPDLSSALALIDTLVADCHSKGFSDQQIAFGGFSQGACLASEYAARNARKYAGLFVFSGALIGPQGMPRNYAGSFEKMPVFIGGSDVDPWVSYGLIQRYRRGI